MKNIFLAITAFGILFTACTKEKGCMDSTSLNYNADAEEDDGSCVYDNDTTTTTALQILANDDAVTTPYNTAITINVLANDTGASISISSIVSNPSNGTASISGNSIVYTPNSTYSGNDSFTYEITNTAGTKSTATVTVTVSPEIVVTNNPPTFSGSISLTSSNNSTDVSSNLLDTDNDVVTITSITGASNGTVTVNGTTVSYTPNNALWVGTENLSVTISDGTSTVTTNVTLNYGSTAQIATYNLISQYFGNTFSASSDIKSLTLNSDGTLTSEINDNFYGVNATSATYVILENGKIRMNVSNVGAIFTEFEVTELNNTNNDNTGYMGLIFTGLGVNNNTVNLKVWN